MPYSFKRVADRTENRARVLTLRQSRYDELQRGFLYCSVVVTEQQYAPYRAELRV